MEFIRHPIDGVVEIRPRRISDDRGFFVETYKRAALAAEGIEANFVQDNHALSIRQGTVRGLHFQLEPFAQAKLVSVSRGAVYDVAVDVRRASPTFGRHVAVRLSAELGNQLFIPVGFAHGYCTVEPNSEIMYKVTAPYAPECDRCVSWSDPALAIDWPVALDEAALSDKDARAPLLADAPDLF